ncbi:MAG: hypothetical protein JWL64_404, partial [Frankiales bacterium]|nr:hypothetical protein [Frankiales bacterium]
ARAAVHRWRTTHWPGATEVLLDGPGCLVHSVADGSGVPDVWLTWTLAEVEDETCRVTLALDEQAGAAPDPELDRVLAGLLRSCRTFQRS